MLSMYMVKQEFKDILLGIIRRKAGENGKHVHQKLIPDYILFLVNNPKKPMNAKLLKESDQKNSYNLGYSNDLMKSSFLFWVIPKITFANLCKPIHVIIIIIPVSSEPLNLRFLD